MYEMYLIIRLGKLSNQLLWKLSLKPLPREIIEFLEYSFFDFQGQTLTK